MHALTQIYTYTPENTRLPGQRIHSISATAAAATLH